jgi:hypothetical protein
LAEVERRRRVDADAGGGRPADNAGDPAGRRARDPEEHVQAGVRARHGHPLAEVLGDRGEQGRTALAVPRPRAAQVALASASQAA